MSDKLHPFTMSETISDPALESMAQDRALGMFFPALGLIRYNFDWKKYASIKGPIANNRVLVEEYGTIHHEIYHYLQLISTSYCCYLFLLESSKAAAYRDLITAFAPKDGPFPMPFWAHLNLPESDAQLTDEQRCFRDTHFQHGNSAHILQELLQKGTRISEMNSTLAQAVARFATDGIRDGPHPFAPCFSYDLEIGGAIHAMDDAKVQITGEMILENAAFMISTYPFWHHENKNGTALVLETIQAFGTVFYARLIELAARALDIERASTFKNTFLAITELSLNVPVSSGPVNWMEAHPGWRFVRALAVARSLSPIEDYSKDYAGFITAICNQLGWQSPLVIAEEIARISLSSNDRHWLTLEAMRAMKEKLSNPWKFFDPGDDLFLASDWIARNFPPMVEDSANGRVILTRRLELATATLDWYFYTKVPQRLMLNRSVDFILPGLQEQIINDHIEKNLLGLGLCSNALRSMSAIDTQSGYANYEQRKKYYRLSLSTSPSEVFFRS